MTYVPDDHRRRRVDGADIKAASLAVADDVKEADRREIERLMREEVLEVETLSRRSPSQHGGHRRAPAPARFRVDDQGHADAARRVASANRSRRRST